MTTKRRKRLPKLTLIREAKYATREVELSLWKSNDFAKYLITKEKIKPFKAPPLPIMEFYLIKTDELAEILSKNQGIVMETKKDLPYSFRFFARFTSGDTSLILEQPVSDAVLEIMSKRLDRTVYELSVRIKEEVQEVGQRKSLRNDWLAILLNDNKD